MPTDTGPGETPDHLPVRRGRPPTLARFLREINSYGIQSDRVRATARQLSYFQVAALRGHPEFQAMLDGIVLKAIIFSEDIDESLRWALKFLRDSAPKAFSGKRGYAAGDDSVEVQRLERTLIDVRPESPSA